MKDIIRSIYEEYATSANECEDLEFPGPRQIQLGRLVGSKKRVLDIGCSIGINLAYLRDIGNVVVGLDIAGPYVDISRRRKLEVYDCNIETEEVPNLEPFDVVIMTEFLEHLIDPIKVLQDPVRKLLKDDGFFIVSTINCAFIRYRLALLIGRLPDFGENKTLSGRPYNLHHKTFFTYDSFLAVLRESGFDPLDIEPVTHNGTGLWTKPSFRLIKKLLQSMSPRLFVSDIIVRARKINAFSLSGKGEQL